MPPVVPATFARRPSRAQKVSACAGSAAGSGVARSTRSATTRSRAESRSFRSSVMRPNYESTYLRSRPFRHVPQQARYLLPVLHDLSTVDWAALPHADEVPELLRATAEGDSGALEELHRELCDEGMIGPATPYAVPFLIRILDALAADQWRLLLLLAEIARAGVHEAPYRHETDPGTTRARVDAERSLTTRTRAAVVAGLPSYLRLL